MSIIENDPRFLRNVLLVDAATCVVTGLLMTFGAGLLAGLTQLPPELLRSAGISLFPIAAFIAFVATRAELPRTGVWLVILGNAVWVAASLWVIFGGAINPNALGYAFVAVQALAVAVLAELEFTGMRKLSVVA
jgi:hypothetical protein